MDCLASALHKHFQSYSWPIFPRCPFPTKFSTAAFPVLLYTAFYILLFFLPFAFCLFLPLFFPFSLVLLPIYSSKVLQAACKHCITWHTSTAISSFAPVYCDWSLGCQWYSIAASSEYCYLYSEKPDESQSNTMCKRDKDLWCLEVLQYLWKEHYYN